jgi:hypothetical protein
MKMTDDDLLAMLHAEFAADPDPALEPPPERVVALRRAVAEHAVRPRHAPGMFGMLRNGARRGSMLLAAGGLVIGGATAAAAATGNLPRPVRALAHDLGLGAAPRSAPTVSDQLAELRKALLHHDEAKAAALVTQLNHRAGHLDANEQAQLRQQVDTILHQAEVAPPDQGTVGQTPPDSVSPGPRTMPGPPETAPSDTVPPSDPSVVPPTTNPSDPPPTQDTVPPVPPESPPPTSGSAGSPDATTDSTTPNSS